MKYVRLGTTNLDVSRFCLGTMMFGDKTTKEEATRIIHAAIDGGINFIDTADVYTEGRSEEITGAAIKEHRESVVLASKVGMKKGNAPSDLGVSRYHIIRGVEASLKRLGTDRLDLLYIHWPAERMNLEEMTRAVEDLVNQGKVLYPACSNFPAWLLTRAMWIQELHGYHPMVVGQYPYNPIERGLEIELLPAAKALGVGIVVYRPLAIGLLTGKYLDGVPSDARGGSDERIARWNKSYGDAVRKMAAFAQARGWTTVDAANQWVCSHPAVTSAIVGISRMEQLVQNLKGFEWEMTQKERAEITAYFPTEIKEEAGGQFANWRRSYSIIEG
ncbi:MAG TPA: aldo/keto reductase [Spirochaetia bacterium]|nr:aldo/keto reductase [Spirochaetia bacterium]